MPRSSWKGFIKLSLVSVPVKGYTATSSGGGQIRLNQLHEECNSRIKYQKVCPIHGEVPNDEIVMGYEYAKDQYAVIDPSELDKLRSESDRAVNIDRFVSPDELDAIYFSGKSYYLTPDGPAGQKSYALLYQAMADEGVCAVAQVVLHGKEQLVVVRPVEGLLVMSVLHYESDLKKPSAFEDDITDGQFSKEELQLAKTLVEQTTTEELSLDDYKDLYTERLRNLVEAKVEGKEIVTSPADEGPPVINLMEALKQSVKQSKDAAPKKAAKKGAKKKVARSAKTRKTPAKKKKSG